jgi:hypothetical protein
MTRWQSDRIIVNYDPQRSLKRYVCYRVISRRWVDKDPLRIGVNFNVTIRLRFNQYV